MKKWWILLLVGAMMLALGVGCDKGGSSSQEEEKEPSVVIPSTPPEGCFYYFRGEKIFLRQIKEKIFVNYELWTDPPYEIVTNSDTLSNALIDFYKAKPEVVSATYVLQSENGGQVAVTERFVVKLKEASAYTQLHELAKSNGCILGAENEFVKNKYRLTVPKTSDWDAMQMANLFYETGLFQYSEPSFIIFNALHSSADQK